MIILQNSPSIIVMNTYLLSIQKAPFIVSAQNEDLYVELRLKRHSNDDLNLCYQNGN